MISNPFLTSKVAQTSPTISTVGDAAVPSNSTNYVKYHAPEDLATKSMLATPPEEEISSCWTSLPDHMFQPEQSCWEKVLGELDRDILDPALLGLPESLVTSESRTQDVSNAGKVLLLETQLTEGPVVNSSKLQKLFQPFSDVQTPSSQNTGLTKPTFCSPRINVYPTTTTQITTAPTQSSSHATTTSAPALHLAAAKGHSAILSLLLISGAHVNGLDSRARTALHYAGEAGQVDAVRLLLKYGADAKMVDVSGQSVLHVAVEAEREDVVRLLVEKGVDVNLGGG
jgi:Ankyrin repeats (3 copies)